MARQAHIIGTATDIHGRQWDVREARPTRHGWPVLLGWPSDTPRGQGGGGPRVILTRELASYLESIRMSPKDADLPIGSSVIKKMRKALGLSWLVDNCRWWVDNPDGPGKTAAAVSVQRKLRGLRTRMWTKEQDATLLHMAAKDTPLADIGRAFGKSEAAIRARLRRLRRTTSLPPLHDEVGPAGDVK